MGHGAHPPLTLAASDLGYARGHSIPRLPEEPCEGGLTLPQTSCCRFGRGRALSGHKVTFIRPGRVPNDDRIGAVYRIQGKRGVRPRKGIDD